VYIQGCWRNILPKKLTERPLVVFIGSSLLRYDTERAGSSGAEDCWLVLYPCP
jgi:hypothetical protein